MSGIPKRMLQWLVRFLVFAYKSLVLSFLYVAVLKYAFHDGGWFNFSIATLALSCPLVLVRIRSRLRKSDKQTVT